MKYIIALDAGTTSIRAFLYDLGAGRFVHRAQQEVESRFPHPGWVEQDAEEIYFKAAYVLNDCARAAEGEILAVGITNQRETVVCWDRKTGEPVAPAIVWQCRRTSEYCASLEKDLVKYIRTHTGLLPDAYFSASKIHWILQNVPAARRLAAEKQLCAGTIDSFLIFKLTEGKRFTTDYTNASRTMLFDIRKLAWDEHLLDAFSVPRDALPEALPCDAKMGEVVLAGKRVPIIGVLGDQQAALFGQACLTPGDGKVTYGTGLFMLFPTGESPVASENGLLTTVAYSLCGRTTYALEGSAFHAGSAVQWLRDELGLIENAAETERIASSVKDTGGVRFVPAFTGLGAPYWDPDARAILSGISRGTTRAEIVRAVLESIAYGARDLADCMTADSGIALCGIKCDGGASANSFLMQFQADVLGIPVDRPLERESTALGAALAAAVGLGELGIDELPERRKTEALFLPSDERARFEEGYRDYRMAVRRALLRP